MLAFRSGVQGLGRLRSNRDCSRRPVRRRSTALLSTSRMASKRTTVTTPYRNPHSDLTHESTVARCASGGLRSRWLFGKASPVWCVRRRIRPKAFTLANQSAFVWARRLTKSLSARLHESITEQDRRLVHVGFPINGGRVGGTYGMPKIGLKSAACTKKTRISRDSAVISFTRVGAVNASYAVPSK